MKNLIEIYIEKNLNGGFIFKARGENGELLTKTAFYDYTKKAAVAEFKKSFENAKFEIYDFTK